MPKLRKKVQAKNWQETSEWQALRKAVGKLHDNTPLVQVNGLIEVKNLGDVAPRIQIGLRKAINIAHLLEIETVGQMRELAKSGIESVSRKLTRRPSRSSQRSRTLFALFSEDR